MCMFWVHEVLDYSQKHKDWDTKSINRTTLRQKKHTQTLTKTHIHSLTHTHTVAAMRHWGQSLNRETEKREGEDVR